MYVYIYIYIYIHVCIYIYIYIYTCDLFVYIQYSYTTYHISGAVMYVRSKPKRSPHFDHNPYNIPNIFQSISYTKNMNSVGFC